MRIGLRIAPSRPLPEIAQLVRRAEVVGFDTVAISDSPMLWRDTYAALCFAAVETETVTLTSNVSSLITRQPTTLASAARTVGELAPGRFRLGIGAGNSAATLTDQKPSSTRELREGIQVISDLLAGRPAHEDTPYLILHDPCGSVQIFLAADGPRNLALAAQVADGVTTSFREVAKKAATLAVAVKEANRDRPLVHVVQAPVRITDDFEHEAYRLKPNILNYIQREGAQAVEAAGFFVSLPKLAPEPDGTDLGHARDLDAAAKVASEYISDDLALWFAKHLAVIGTTDEIAAHFLELAAYGVDEVICSNNSAFTLPFDMLEQLASDVIPKLHSATNNQLNGS